MKLLFLCKRRPQGKDLFERPYGRFYLPKLMAEKNHVVHVLLLSYENEPKIAVKKDDTYWYSTSLKRHGPWSYTREAARIIRRIKPDWIGGFSDTYYGILAQSLGTKYNINSLIDAYDNYESYIPWCLPLHYYWRRALSKATLVTAAGESLSMLLEKQRPGKPTEIIPMAADPLFQPMNKMECRRKFGLPENKKLIGYSGSSLIKKRGLDILFESFSVLKQEIPDLELVLTGRKGRDIKIPSEVNWLGYLPDENMPALMNSLDALVVINPPTAFGNYSYPVKLYEAMRCQTPVVVTKTMSTQEIMRDTPQLLVESGSAQGLGEKIKFVLDQKKAVYPVQNSWNTIGERLETLLVKYTVN